MTTRWGRMAGTWRGLLALRLQRQRSCAHSSHRSPAVAETVLKVLSGFQPSGPNHRVVPEQNGTRLYISISIFGSGREARTRAGHIIEIAWAGAFGRRILPAHGFGICACLSQSLQFIPTPCEQKRAAAAIATTRDNELFGTLRHRIWN